MKITNEQKERVKVLLGEIYEIIEKTDDSVSIKISRDGIRIYANYTITALSDWDKVDDAWTLDTMRELLRLEIETGKEEIGATKQETDTTEEQ